jgi:sigma-B regulation protein RsbU (phosphoserine phosphatase)
VNGGHHPALLRHPDGSVQELDSEGMPIGLLPDPGYEQGSISAEPGAVLLLFSDGVVENRAPDGSMFGTPRLIDFLVEHGDRDDLIDRLLAALEQHRAGGPRQDDVTIVEVRLHRDDRPSGAPGER